MLAKVNEVEGLGLALAVTGWACAGFLASVGGEFNFGNDPGVGTVVGLVGSAIVAVFAIGWSHSGGSVGEPHATWPQRTRTDDARLA